MDQRHVTPLNAATFGNDTAAVRLLLDAGADLDTPPSPRPQSSPAHTLSTCYFPALAAAFLSSARAPLRELNIA